ncbi:UDP-3-O-[3-hydroxymyristoyl] N-acetylglucosamine deacetylase [Richelia intracellularis HH01]|jgi:UDP-3-O-acyl-N-acetylglucosamine deacetylase|uniref:UDP-3-O-[3-hydroxymyristoyl] N-acetylglucosamine deacetylase n=1 Tax=Richelia intracellularis HH01 TaxID=1165094 RepID=M1X269_9NOST|nr:UDP-3-O-acyl-N-acetylglucosamine deacetylase [Richelia intracellularis]CCH66305.1 UDP-3-O-[3-hydroxymyristoyl] N-acetylglucosamine deacetylase [Richelia intracellularis HH01]
MQPNILAKEITRSGVELYTGLHTQLRILPAPTGSNHHFVCVDLPENPIILAQVISINHTHTFYSIGLWRIQYTHGRTFTCSPTAISNQWYSWSLGADMEVAHIKPETNIAPARTFCLLHQIE